MLGVRCLKNVKAAINRNAFVRSLINGIMITNYIRSNQIDHVCATSSEKLKNQFVQNVANLLFFVLSKREELSTRMSFV